jgi:hypothetical protein
MRRFDVMAATVATLEADIGPVHSRCDTLASELSTTREQLVSAERRVQSLSDVGAAISSRVTKNSGSLDDLYERLEGLGVAIARLEGRGDRAVSALRSDLDAALIYIDAAKAQSMEQERSIALMSRRIDGFAVADDILPPGTILPWLPGGAGVPDGWAVCDGSNGTPDLRGIFLRGASFMAEAGQYEPGGSMRPAGRHSHATEEYLTFWNITRSVSREVGDGRILFDTGVAESDPQSIATHGEHVHADEHVPEHVKVVFIFKHG